MDISKYLGFHCRALHIYCNHQDLLNFIRTSASKTLHTYTYSFVEIKSGNQETKREFVAIINILS